MPHRTTAYAPALLAVATAQRSPNARLGRQFLLMVVVALVAPLLVVAAPASAMSTLTYEKQVVSTTNNVRESHHMRKLRTGRCLEVFAERHARRMARTRELFHQDLQVPLRRCGLHRVAENVAVGYPSGRTVVRSGWMKSAGHRANILTQSHRRTGAGVHQDSSGGWWAVQLLGS